MENSTNNGVENLTRKLPVLFAAVMGSYGAVFSFISGLDIICHKNYIAAAIAVLFLLFFNMIFLENKKRVFAEIVLALTGVFCIIKYGELLINGFFYVENDIIDTLNDRYDLNILYFVAEHSEKNASTVFMLFCTVIICVMAVFACFFEIQRFAAILLLTFMTAGPVVAGGSPDAAPIIFFVAFLVLDNAYRIIPEGVSRTGIFASFIVFFSLSVTASAVIMSSSGFEDFTDKKQEKRDAFIKTVKEMRIDVELNNIKNEIKDFLFSKDEKKINIIDASTLSGGLGNGVLARSGKISFTNETMLRLTLPYDYEAFYLRGYVGANYTENGWEGLNDSQKADYTEFISEYKDTALRDILRSRLMNYNYQNKLIISRPTVIVDYAGADKNTVYASAYTDADIPGAEENYDVGYVPSKGSKDSYTFSFYEFDINDIYWLSLNELYAVNYAAHGYQRFEKEYRQYVYDTYTTVPEGLTTLRAEADELYGDLINQYRVSLGSTKIGIAIDILERTKQYIAEHADYTLAPQKIPADEDFAEYFLYTSHEGYCVHYATSAVLMLRSAGIPARYVEGYIVTNELKDGAVSGDKIQSSVVSISNTFTLSSVTKDKLTIEVKDTNAHAWVEVYLDGYGWVEYEMTEGYSKDNVNSKITDEVLKSGIETTKMPTITPTSHPAAPTPTYALSVTPELNATSTPVVTNTPTPTLKPKRLSSTPTPAGAAAPGSEDRGGLSETELKLLIRVLETVLCIVLIVTAFMIKALLLKKHEQKKLESDEAFEKFSYAYRRILAILRYKGLYPPENDETYEGYALRLEKEENIAGIGRVFEIAQKAAFSKEGINAEEAEYIKECLIAYRDKLYTGKNLLEAFYLKHIKNL